MELEDYYEFTTVFKCKECGAFRENLDSMTKHVKKHMSVKSIFEKYPILNEPIKRNSAWVEEISTAGEGSFGGPLGILLDRLRRYCPYCEFEFPNLMMFAEHNCNCSNQPITKEGVTNELG